VVCAKSPGGYPSRHASTPDSARSHIQGRNRMQ
jgi:hypothetical protein